MLIATWILAIATAILALSGPVALFAWLSARKQDKERRQRERDDEAREQMLKQVKEKFVSRDTANSVAAVSVIAAVLGMLAWFDSRKPKA
jgi:flagellar basal body-associated protein FliL